MNSSIKIEQHDDMFNIKQKGYYVNKRVAYMCPKCFHINYGASITHYSDTNISSNTLDRDSLDELSNYLFCDYSIPLYLKCTCSNEKTKHISLDYNIASIVSKFNKLGFNTLFSCEGEYDTNNNELTSLPYIMILGDISESFKNINTLEYWKIKVVDNLLHGTCTQFYVDESNISLSDAMDNLFISELENFLDNFNK